MPTYVQLASEPVWGAQRTSDIMLTELIEPLRKFYGLGPASIGAAGDNNHLYGRHRSYNWDRTSVFCTNPDYGTTDPRDQGGDRNAYRAFDVGITGEQLQAASRRVDALVRSGRAPGIAEWFGTLDGHVVIGWYEGHPSTSDDSHLSHLHVGLWNESTGDVSLAKLIYQTITGTAPKGQTDMIGLRDPEGGEFTVAMDPLSPTGYFYTPVVDGARSKTLQAGGVVMVQNGTRPGAFGPSAAEVRKQAIIDTAAAVVAKLPPSAGGTAPTLAQIAAAVRAELDATKLGH